MERLFYVISGNGDRDDDRILCDPAVARSKKAFLSNKRFHANVKCFFMFEMNNDAVILCPSAIQQGAFTPTVVQVNPALIFRTVPKFKNSFYTKGFTVKLDLW